MLCDEVVVYQCVMVVGFVVFGYEGVVVDFEFGSSGKKVYVGGVFKNCVDYVVFFQYYVIQVCVFVFDGGGQIYWFGFDDCYVIKIYGFIVLVCVLVYCDLFVFVSLRVMLGVCWLLGVVLGGLLLGLMVCGFKDIEGL